MTEQELEDKFDEEWKLMEQREADKKEFEESDSE